MSREHAVNGESRLFDFTPQNTESIYLGASNRTTKIYYGHGRPMPMRFFRMEFWRHGQKIADMLPVKPPATGDLQIWNACRKLFLTKLYGELEEPTDEI